MYIIRNEKNQQSFSCMNDENVLAAAIRSGVTIPYGCQSGGCGMCKIKILQGETILKQYSKASLSDLERKENITLACVSTPKSNLHFSIVE